MLPIRYRKLKIRRIEFCNVFMDSDVPVLQRSYRIQAVTAGEHKFVSESKQQPLPSFDLEEGNEFTEEFNAVSNRDLTLEL
jgi:hypothetical protein